MDLKPAVSGIWRNRSDFQILDFEFSDCFVRL